LCDGPTARLLTYSRARKLTTGGSTSRHMHDGLSRRRARRSNPDSLFDHRVGLCGAGGEQVERRGRLFR
jgi:hypothetical protein